MSGNVVPMQALRINLRARIVRCWKLKNRRARSMETCRSCVMVDIFKGICREDSSESMHMNDITTLLNMLKEADNGIGKIS